jgi:tryptophan-rich sensory protein
LSCSLLNKSSRCGKYSSLYSQYSICETLWKNWKPIKLKFKEIVPFWGWVSILSIWVELSAACTSSSVHKSQDGLIAPRSKFCESFTTLAQIFAKIWCMYVFVQTGSAMLMWDEQVEQVHLSCSNLITILLWVTSHFLWEFQISRPTSFRDAVCVHRSARQCLLSSSLLNNY